MCTRQFYDYSSSFYVQVYSIQVTLLAEARVSHGRKSANLQGFHVEPSTGAENESQVQKALSIRKNQEERRREKPQQ